MALVPYDGAAEHTAASARELEKGCFDEDGYFWGYFWEYYSEYLEFEPEFCPWALHAVNGLLMRWPQGSEEYFDSATNTYELRRVASVSCVSPDPEKLFFIILQGQTTDARDVGDQNHQIDLTLQADSEVEWWQWGRQLSRAFALLEPSGLFASVYQGDFASLKKMFQSNGTDLCLVHRDVFKNTPLIIAAALGRGEMLSWMLSIASNPVRAAFTYYFGSCFVVTTSSPFHTCVETGAFIFSQQSPRVSSISSCGARSC